MEISLFYFALALLSLNSLTSSSSTIFNLTTDQHALLAFQSTITDPNGVLAKNWSTDTSICQWTGVSCGQNHRRVTALNVSRFGLMGTIAPQLGNLGFLQSLDLSFNNFTGSIPPELSSLGRRLKVINFETNQITGPIPNGMFHMPSLIEINMRDNRLSGMLPNDMCSGSNNITSKLKKINLFGNQLSGEIPRNIYKCTELEELWLRKNRFSGNIPSEIGSLNMLSFLYLGSNSFSGSIPSFIFNISSLKIVDLSENNLVGSIPTGSFHNLHSQIEQLIVSNNQVTGSIPKEIGNLTSLTVLDFYFNKLTGSIPKEIGNLNSLTWLDFASNRLTGELPQELGNGNMPYLQGLVASFNDLSGSIPSSIFNMSALTVLSLQQNLLSGSLPASMGLYLPNLRELYLFYNRLSGQIPHSITNASMLTIVELNRNSFSGSIPDFGDLEQLQVLRLWENKLTGAKSPNQELGFISSLIKCRYLEFLEITNNPLNGVLPTSVGNLSTSLVRFLATSCNITGTIPSEIGNLNTLEALYLNENQLTGSIPTTIRNLTQLQELSLGGNRLEGYIPNELCQLKNVRELNLGLSMLVGPIPECLGDVESLRTLDLSSNKLNSTIPSKFWDLTDLVFLYLSSNSLTGHLSPQIQSWKRIQVLDLSSNQFTGEIPNPTLIGDWQSLEYLSLSDNKFGGSIPSSLGNVRGLKTLNLSNNSLSGWIPASLQRLRDLEYLSVSYNNLEGEIPNGGSFENFNATSFAHNSHLCGVARFGVSPCKSHSSNAARMVKYIVPSFVAAIILAVITIVVLIRRRKQKKTPPLIDNYSLEKAALRRVSYIELVQGTSSFSEENLLGRGSFGSVFKASLSDELNIAAKVFNLQLEAASKSFQTECEILSSIRHRNLVPVIGCCTNNEFKALILKYMPNGSLDQWLHHDNERRLDLVQRLDIATDVALALEYLHHGHTFPVVHCDIKPSNVLLDQDMTAHVGDFGISKLFDQGEVVIQTTTLATVGYAAPEYGSEGKVSTNGDVYSYGILLLEMFTEKKPTDDMFNAEMSLKDWVAEAIHRNALSEVAAAGLLPNVQDQHFAKHEQCVSSIFDMALRCLAFAPDERIDMIQAVSLLQKMKAKLIVRVNNV